MEDGPKLLPQWLRGSSSALHHRGETTSDASKRAVKPAGGADSAQRPSSQGNDPWLPRGGGTAAPLNSATGGGAAPGKGAPADFARGPDRGGLSDRSWKPRDNGFPNTTSSRSGYVPAGLKPGSRDDRDGISLKPAGGYGSAGRAYGRPEPESGGGGGSGGRLERGPEGWQSARTAATGPGGGRADDDSRSPLLVSALANGGGGGGGGGITAMPSKASFEADFPSLRPAPAPSPSPVSSGSPGPQQASSTSVPSAATSAPLLGATSSALLDTASSAAVLPPYRQTFLSSRTSSNWTSKLAEAPAAPSPGPNLSTQIPAGGASEDPWMDSLAPPPPPATPLPPPPSAAPLTSPAAATSGPAPAAPVPVVPPRPSGVWGAAASAAVAAADSGHAGTATVGVPAATRMRSEHLATRQWKQLIPVMSSGSNKSKSGGLGGGGVSGLGGAVGGVGGGAGGGPGARATGAGPKPVVPAVGLLKMSAAGKRDDVVSGLGGAAAAGTRMLTSSTVILSKKVSQPLDRPLALTRTASASAPVASALVAAPPPPPPLAVGPSARAGGVSGGGGSVAAGPYLAWAGTHAVAGVESGAAGVENLIPADPAVAMEGRRGEPQATIREPQAQIQPEPRAPAAAEAVAAAAASQSHPALQVSEEEEAFLRSLGWTGFDEEDGEDGEDTGLTEEEIAAFRAQQQRQQEAAAAAVAAGGPLAAAAAAPKAVPEAVRRRGKPLIVAASYGSEQLSSSTDSESECE